MHGHMNVKKVCYHFVLRSTVTELIICWSYGRDWLSERKILQWRLLDSEPIPHTLYQKLVISAPPIRP